MADKSRDEPPRRRRREPQGRRDPGSGKPPERRRARPDDARRSTATEGSRSAAKRPAAKDDGGRKPRRPAPKTTAKRNGSTRDSPRTPRAASNQTRSGSGRTPPRRTTDRSGRQVPRPDRGVPAKGARPAAKRPVSKRPVSKRPVSKRPAAMKRPVAKKRPAPKRRPRTLRLGRPALRLRVAFFTMTFVLSLFAGRLVVLQGIDANSYASAAAKENTKEFALHASRGAILDRDGVPLAISEEAVQVTADPKLTREIAPKLAALLDPHLTTATYDQLVTALMKPDTRFVSLSRHVPPKVWERIKADLKKAELGGVYSEPDPVRVHPNGSLAANVIGFLGKDGKPLGGFEYGLNTQLSGQDGKAMYEVDKKGNRIPLANHTVAEPKPGMTAKLTLDRDLQWYAQERIAQQVRLTGAESGSVVMIDTKTGEVVVDATYPSYDLDNPNKAKKGSLGNRTLEQVYEPGSVQKVVTMAALADAGKVTPTTKIQVPPGLRIGGRTIGDHFDHGTLKLTAAGVIAKSSNIGTIIASKQLGEQQFIDYLRRFGFGQPTGIDFPGESRGLMPAGDDWSELTRANVAFGQGLSVNAVQMAAAVNVIANRGVYVPPKLVKEYVDAAGRTVPAPAPESRRVVSPLAAAQVTAMMEAVTGDGGTAKPARIPGYRVAGKTGTAQQADPECGCYRKWATSFAGFAPADNPRFVTYVVLQNPTNGRSGGGQGGPVFKDVMSYALQKYAVPPTGAKPPSTPLTW